MHWTCGQRYAKYAKHARSSVAVGTALLALALSACGATSSSPSGAAAATAAAPATAQPTTTTVALPPMCPNMSDASVGDLITSKIAGAFVATGEQIPQGTANQPLKISSNGQMANINPDATPIGSSGHGYYTFTICNASSQTVTLRSVAVRVASFMPYTGTLAAWDLCKDGFYDANQQLASSGGCGGGYAANEYLQASFPSSAGVGDSVTAQVTSSSPAEPSDPNPYPKLPLAVAPGKVVSIAATVTTPTAPGTYTFSFGLGVGADAPAYFGAASSALYAPVSQEWSGQNCTEPAMKAQIPASPQGTLYICPPAA